MTRPQPGAPVLVDQGLQLGDVHTKSPVNADFGWDGFDSESYFQHNFADLRSDDRQILESVRDFFADSFNDPATHGSLRGLDVGPGANLYPVLSMLPYCAGIDMREYSRQNIAWLRNEIAGYRDSWDEFWTVLCKRDVYAAIGDPRRRLSDTAGPNIGQASIFELPRQRWDVGTMFFVAESLTGDRAEFVSAVHHFVRALRPGAPFAAAFMAESEGYFVGGTWFPAVAIDGADVTDCLQGVANKVTVKPVESITPLREGYGGMLLATGVAAGD